MPTYPILRRLSRGPVSIQMDYDDLHMILTCTVHDETRRVPFGNESVSPPVVEFFRQHRECAAGASFDLDER